MQKARPGIDTKEIMKSAKENEELKKFIQSLRVEEIKYLRKVRDFETVKPGTWSYKIALYNDAIRSNIRGLKIQVEKTLSEIGNIGHTITNCNAELKAGLRTTKNDKGFTMTVDELKSYVQTLRWLRNAEAASLAITLGKMRGEVKFKDVAMNVIMTHEEFEEYCVKIDERLKVYGYSLCGKNNL